MESVWFYVLCFYIWKMFGKIMLVPGITRGYFQLYRRNILYRKKLDLKNDRKKFGAFIKPRCQKQKKEQLQKHLLLAVSIFSNVKQLIKGYTQIRKHSQGYELLKESVHMQGKNIYATDNF